MNENFWEEYNNDYKLYHDYVITMKHLIIKILKKSKINYHSVTSRVKTKDSVRNKFEKSKNKYKCLADMTDIAGVRIITYFENDVDIVANIIEDEFVIDKDNSIDKRLLLDPDRFGYLSLHHVVSLLPTRISLVEYEQFLKLKAEIQTRSILQHAWAEMEHDLGYKSKQGIPKTIRRSFSRLAGMLELADIEFIRIRNDLRRYEEEVKSNIEKDSSLVTIDKLSLTSFIDTSEIIQKLDLEIAATCQGIIKKRFVDRDLMVEQLTYFNIETISNLEKILGQNKDKILKFATKWLSNDKGYIFDSGLSIYYLNYILIAETRDHDKILKYFEHFKFVNPLTLTEEIINTYNSLKF